MNNKPNVLIDDYKNNIVEWESAGGTGVHHTDIGKTIAELDDDTPPEEASDVENSSEED